LGLRQGGPRGRRLASGLRPQVLTALAVRAALALQQREVRIMLTHQQMDDLAIC